MTMRTLCQGPSQVLGRGPYKWGTLQLTYHYLHSKSAPSSQ